jgi:eukaryotic-like serine/threonine-protein kinase
VRLSPGTLLGPYEVLSTLGTGGMAEVYRARDTRLGRDIALKVVNAALADDPELVQRFEQEARLAGSLNHPNLVAVYDFGRHEGAPYFITELLKGESLRARLSRGRVPVDTALAWGAQLAEGLAAAHGHGIVHRDVKPENVFVTSDGHLKLLDFGIAKLVEANPATGPHGLLEETATPTAGHTRTGAILGTPAYMSPEQVRGERVDARTDIFSLGVVLYEMLSGQRAFAGDSLVESGHAILHDEPPPLPDVPPFLAQLIRRCLAKDPEARLQSARDLAFALEALRLDVERRPASRRSALRSFLRRPWWALAVLAVLGAAVVIGRLQPSDAPASPTAVEQVTFRPAFPRSARFTPDGRVVFTERQGGTEALFERNLASASIQPLGLQNMLLAAISSTGELAVLLTSSPFVTGVVPATLARVPGGGGTPQPVAENVVSADWSRSGELAIVRHEGTRSVLEFPIGKAVFQTTRPAWVGNVRISPRGDLLAFIHYPTGEFQGEVVVVDLQGRKRQVSRQWRRAVGLSWSPRSEVWFTAGDTLPTQVQAMPVAGPERTVYTALAPIVIHDIAADGSALIGQGLTERDITFLGEGAANPRSLGWGDRDNSPRLSADGRLVLFSTWGTRVKMVALLRKTSGAPPQQLGEGFGVDISPDGRWALLGRDHDGLTLVATGTGTRRNVPLPSLEFGATRFVGGTSRALAVARSSTDSGYRLYSIDLDRSIATPLSEPIALDGSVLEISPDSQWAATSVVADEKAASVLHPLSGGKPVTLTGLPPNVRPVGWASKDELWFARVDQADPSVIGLIRFDVRRGVTLQERTIGTGGPGFTGVLHLTPDGKNIVFGQQRTTGHLYVVRGLQDAR